MKLLTLELTALSLGVDLMLLNISIFAMAAVTNSLILNRLQDLTLYLFDGNVLVFIIYFLFTTNNLYHTLHFSKRLARISINFGVFILLSLLFALLPMRQDYFSIHFLLEYSIFFFAIKLLVHWAFFQYRMNHSTKKNGMNHTLIIGINNTSDLVCNILMSNLILGYQFVGFLDESESNHPDYIGHPNHLRLVIEEHHIESVFAIISICSREQRLSDYLETCNQLGVRLRFIPELNGSKSTIPKIETGENLVFINPQEIPLDKMSSRLLKRFFDVVFSICFLVLVFSWLLPLMALIIKLSSKGPVFFIQKRTGINNEIFNCIKFRSMKVNGQCDTHQATKEDYRITRIGRFMRATNIDEMPQFINVLMGSMSVVGPRPHMLKHTKDYALKVTSYMIRHYIKPGLTGWAQVNGYRGITDQAWKMEKRVEFDLQYIENWSLAWDFKIVLRTMLDKRIYYNAG